MFMMWYIWIPLIFLTIWLIIKLPNTNQFNYGQKKESPMDILKRRYANGEISTEEYEQQKRVLKEK